MSKRLGRLLFVGASVLSFLIGLDAVSTQAQEPSANVAYSTPVASNVYHITLDEARQRALGNSKLRQLALYNVQAKGEAVYVAESDYYPKVLANFTGFHFDSPLGKVLTPGILPISPIAVNVVNQDLGLVDLPPLCPTITCADQAISLALANNPAILQADWTAAKAEAGVKVAQVD